MKSSMVPTAINSPLRRTRQEDCPKCNAARGVRPSLWDVPGAQMLFSDKPGTLQQSIGHYVLTYKNVLLSDPDCGNTTGLGAPDPQLGPYLCQQSLPAKDQSA